MGEKNSECAPTEDTDEEQLMPEDFEPAEEENLSIREKFPSHPLGRRYSSRLQQKALDSITSNIALMDLDISSPDDHLLPRNIQEALGNNEWRTSVNAEFQSLEELGTFEEVPISSITKRPIPVKWVFKVKRDASGQVSKYKSRLVVCGNCQEKSENEMNYAPVIRRETMRYLLHLAVNGKLPIRQADVSNAFCQSAIDRDDIYVSDIPGFECSPGHVRRIRRSLYGLRQSPKLWNLTSQRPFWIWN
jgi:hypothetical protein